MATHSQGPAKKWRKILYEKQDYPDNYVDPEQFLKELKNNRKMAVTGACRLLGRGNHDPTPSLSLSLTRETSSSRIHREATNL